MASGNIERQPLTTPGFSMARRVSACVAGSLFTLVGFAVFSQVSACSEAASEAGWQGMPTTELGAASDGGSVDTAPVVDAAHAIPPSSYDGSIGTTTDEDAAVTCSGKTGGTGKVDVAIVSGGKMRTAHLYIPSTYDPSKGTMLLVNFHGFTMEGLSEEAYTELDDNAERHGYIVVYPDGLEGSWNGGDCCGVAWTGGVDDVQFARDIVARVEATWCVDPKRVHASGYSNGGFLSYELACRASDMFASIYSVAGVLGVAPNLCAPERPVAALELHGTADPVVHWQGGTPVSPWNLGGPITFRSVDTTISTFRTLNNCLGAGTVVYQNGDTSCTDYSSCQDNADVILCTITGGGHTWPDTGEPDAAQSWIGAVSYDVDADEMGFEFLYAHPMK